ncbi:MAG: hypothetical protein EOM13_10315 [Clostridia bacterium]|nr:hypothetical protein [Clostridia bacterium]
MIHIRLLATAKAAIKTSGFGSLARPALKNEWVMTTTNEVMARGRKKAISSFCEGSLSFDRASILPSLLSAIHARNPSKPMFLTVPLGSIIPESQLIVDSHVGV